MRMGVSLGILLPMLVCTLPAEERILPLVEGLGPASIISNIGSVKFSETDIGDGKLLISHSDEWSAKNISQKPIVALVESMRILGDNAVRVER
jgi:hypothetical protein